MNESRFQGCAFNASRYVVGILIVFLSVSAYGQKRVRLKHADVARAGRKDGDRYQRLIGNVEFTQDNTTITCDSAHFFRNKNSVEAFGHVHIVDGDSVDITGSRLEYDGHTRKARLRRNVVFTKKATATLYTDYLDFSRPDNRAYYYNGGKLVDSINVLTSNKGYYNLNSDMASFKRNVKVVNPDYTMMADSLQYNSRTKIIYFVTPTTVIDKDSSTFVYQRGFYDTQTKVSDVSRGTGESEDYVIEGLNYEFDGIRNIAKVRGNVVMTSKEQNLIIRAQASDHFKDRGITKIYNNAYIAKITQDNDTLFLSADTLVSIDSEDETRERLLAYHNVRIFKKDMQGRADSLEYRLSDSTIYFYHDPVLWSDGNQMAADTISMLIENNTISRVFLVNKAFVISQDTLLNFNQIKGRRMTAELADGQINRVVVMGNGESLYFALDEEDQSFMGMNAIICSNITIRFRDGKVNNLSFYVQPDARFIPPHELQDGDTRLKDFEWRIEEKPLRREVVKAQQGLKSGARKK